MKKLIAFLTAVIMALACLPAAAEEQAAATADTPAAATTVDVKLTIDKEEIINLTAAAGAQERAAAAEPVLDLLNALDLKAVSADGGLQIDLGLNGTPVLSLAGEARENGLVIGSSLIPNHLLSISGEQLQSILQQFVPVAADGTEGGNAAAGADMAAAGEAAGKYLGEFMAAVSTAVTAGEAETGTWEFDGVSFDTKTPQDIDEAAVAEAAKKLIQDLLTDEAVRGVLASVPGFDADKVLKSVGEALAGENIPEIKADAYSNSVEGSAAFCAVFEAAGKGQETSACTVTILNKGTGDVKVAVHIAESGADIIVTTGSDSLLAEAIQGEAYIGFKATIGENGITLALLSAPEKAAVTLTATVSREGERTLSLNPEGKTVLAPEDLQGGNAEASAGLVQELQANAMALLQLPEVANLVAAFAAAQQAPAEEAPQAEADPTSWKTLGDVLALDASDRQSTGGEGGFDMTFQYGGRYWWIKADVPQEAMDRYFGVDYNAEDRKAQETAAIGEYEISSVTDLATLAIPQDELDQWTGKTYEDMLEAGWEQNGYEYKPDGLSARMVSGPFQYSVSFGDTVKTPEDWSEEIDFSGGVVADITFDGPSPSFPGE